MVTLREAILAANSDSTTDLGQTGSGADTIDFDLDVFGTRQTITLGGTELTISSELTINGPGADRLTIDANGASRVLLVENSTPKATIRGLHLSGGSTSDGAGIRTFAHLDLLQSMISNSSASDRGGGIRAESAANVLISDSTIYNNTAAVQGGGVQAGGSSVITIVNSTISGNTANGSSGGGGIRAGNTASFDISHSTIAFNQAVNSGGIDADGPTTLTHTIVSNNTASGSAPDIGNNLVATSDFNLIGDAASAGGLTDGNNGNQVGAVADLVTLTFRGGTTLTHALNTASQALNAGNPSIVSPPNNDQRSAPYNRIAGSAIDIGAFERQILPASSFVVNTAVDELDFSNSDVSLREAIAAIGSAGVDTVSFDFPSNVTVNIALDQQLILSDGTDVIIDGLGDNPIQITNATGRVFDIFSSARDVTLKNLTLTGQLTLSGQSGGAVRSNSSSELTLDDVQIENSTSTLYGGGVYSNAGLLSINDSTIRRNEATHVSDNTFGGGIFSFGTTVISSSTIRNNTASVGGGIANVGTATMTESTVADNVATLVAGGIYNNTGDNLSINNSTINGNSAPLSGGIQNQGDLTLSNSTVSSNAATGSAGGVRSSGGTLLIEHSTITQNRADSDGNGSGSVGGVWSDNNAVVTVTHSIVAENFRGTGTSTHDDANFSGGGTFVSNNYNLIGNADPVAALFNGVSDQKGTAAAPLDPLLESLSDVGGPTKTHALLFSSPAVNAGDPAFSNAAIPADQRGLPFPRVFSSAIDIGAFERLTIFDLLIVNTTADKVESYDPNNLSLREAALIADRGNTFTIGFANTLDGQTIDLTLGDIRLAKSVVIDGNSNATGDPVTFIDATGNNSRIFTIYNPEGVIDVTLRDLKLTGGTSDSANADDESLFPSWGGAIFNLSENVTLDSLVIEDNSASRAGGAIANLGSFPEMTINNTVVENNSATLGGGLYQASLANASVSDTQFLGNSASVSGGGIYNNEQAVLSLVDTQLSQNNASDDGGGILNEPDASLDVTGGLISFNSAASQGGGIHNRGTANLTGTRIESNTALVGGGFSNSSIATAILDSVTMTANQATATSDGGGAIRNRGDLTVRSSTIHDNTAVLGGGIYNRTATASVLNTTVSANTASNLGGGIYANDSSVNVHHSTIVLNESPNGSGIRASNSSAISVGHTIAAGGTGSADLAQGGGGSFNSDGYNLIGSVGNTTAFVDGVGGDQIVANAATLLGPLADNGGSTQTHALLLGSTAIDAGNPAFNPFSFSPWLLSDQRGLPYGREVDRIDIGAFEVHPSFENLVVTTSDDELDAFNPDDMSLREAIALVHEIPIGTLGTVTFDPKLAGHTISLDPALGQFLISRGIVIEGLGAGETIIDAQSNSRIFDIFDPNRFIPLVRLEKLTLTGGDSGPENGGAVRNRGAYVEIIESTLKGNSSNNLGGAIANETDATILANFGPSVLNVRQTLLEANDAGLAGAVFNGLNETVTLFQSQVRDNFGGGLFNEGNASVVASTFDGNIASVIGAILNGTSQNANANLTIRDSTLSNNTGGVVNSFGDSTVVNSTISGNVNTAWIQSGGSLSLQHSTIAFNTTGAAAVKLQSGATLSVDHTIIQGNDGVAIDGAYTDNGFNLIEDAPSGATRWDAASGGNNHFYEVVAVPTGITWDDANAAAIAAGGHLATITSQEENDFVFNLINDPQYWFPGPSINFGPYIGGQQTGTPSHPLANWTWVTGESFFPYTAWADGEPNDFDNTIEEDKLAYYSPNNSRQATFNDVLSVSSPIAYVIEYDLGLGPLRNNGGLTETHALLPGSAAIDAGDPSFNPGSISPSLNVDQRVQFGRENGTIDIGAYERYTGGPTTLVVNSTSDVFPASGLTLREAIGFANGFEDGTPILIYFDSSFDDPQTIRLLHGELPITDDVTINPGFNPRHVTIDAHGNSRIFDIDDQVDLQNIAVDIGALTLTGGNADVGGAIFNRENTTIRSSHITDNTASSNGGGIRNLNGVISVFDTVISYNESGENGGGINNRTGHVALTNSTLLGNTAALSGGGIDSNVGSELVVTGSTISSNSAGFVGGGVQNHESETTLLGTTVTGNASGGGEGISSTVTPISVRLVNSVVAGNGSQDLFVVDSANNLFVSHTLIGENTDTHLNPVPVGNVDPTGNENIIGTDASPIDPLLGPIAYNGGPTPTHALLAGSPALDKGSDYGQVVDVDQPTSFWRLNETSGSTATNSGSSGVDGTYVVGNLNVGSPVVDGTAFGVNGFNSFVQANSVPVTASFTVEAWTRSNTSNWNEHGWIASARAANGFILHPDQGTKNWSGYVLNDAGFFLRIGTYTPPVTVDIRDWHHYALSYDETTGMATMYFDGIEVASRDLSGFPGFTRLATANVNLFIGRDNEPTDPNRFGAGSVDEVAIYDRALSALELAAHANQGRADQRGLPFERNDGGGVDMGSYERQTLSLPTPLVVTTLLDEIDTNPLNGGDLSLREAIGLANGSVGTGDDITFDSGLSGTINLGFGQLQVSSDMTITGNGQGDTIIDGNGKSRVLRIDPRVNAIVSNLGITGGDADGNIERYILGESLGGGILNDRATLTLNDVRVFENSATYGGGINNYGQEGVASITVSDSTIDQNSAANAGGLYNWGWLGQADAIIFDSTFEMNTATSFGGAIYNWVSLLYATSTTFSSNSAIGAGGGIYNRGGTVVTNSSTLSSNSTDGTGGGIRAVGGSTEILATTIANNRANRGGGVDNDSTFVSSGSIIAGNLQNDGVTADDLYEDEFGSTFTSSGYNLFDATSGGTISYDPTDILGLDPMLGPLADNGGPTLTHALLPGSPAIDAAIANGQTDQRGSTRTVDLSEYANASGGDGTDIGAFESFGADFGDAPAPYPTMFLDGGAYHEVTGPMLGSQRDTEADGLVSTNADGDDNAGSPDDEDGVLFGGIGINSTLAALNVTASQAAKVDAWVDFNGDGDWADPGEQILASVDVIAGLQTLNYNVPAGINTGETFARVRISSAGGLTPTGFAIDGEVEDYKVDIQASVQPVEIDAVVVNEGDDQRSNTTSITVHFNQQVLAPDDAFILRHREDDTVVDSVQINADDSTGKTVVTLTFDPGAYVVTRAGGPNSLIDGNYDLRIDSALIYGSENGPTPMLADYVFGDLEEHKLFRFFADQNGDRDVDAGDLSGFGDTFRLDDSAPAFDADFDMMGDGDVDSDDLTEFGDRFRRQLPF